MLLKIILANLIDLMVLPINTIVRKLAYTNKLISEKPNSKSDKIKMHIGKINAILLLLKFNPLNKAIAAIGEKFGGCGIILANTPKIIRIKTNFWELSKLIFMR